MPGGGTGYLQSLDIAVFRRLKSKIREASDTSWARTVIHSEEQDLLKSLDFASMNTKQAVMHWISAACIEFGQDETAFTQAWKHLQPVLGPTGPEILAAAKAEHEKGLLFAQDTVAKEKELAEDAWEPAELLLDDHDGEVEELRPQETPGSAGSASDQPFVRELGSAGSACARPRVLERQLALRLLYGRGPPKAK